jgi:hypothetical protein
MSKEESLDFFELVKKPYGGFFLPKSFVKKIVIFCSATKSLYKKIYTIKVHIISHVFFY